MVFYLKITKQVVIQSIVLLIYVCIIMLIGLFFKWKVVKSGLHCLMLTTAQELINILNRNECLKNNCKHKRRK